jgi:hypothetical protein
MNIFDHNIEIDCLLVVDASLLILNLVILILMLKLAVIVVLGHSPVELEVLL